MSEHTPGPWYVSADEQGRMAGICTVYGVETIPTEDGLGQGFVYITAPQNWAEYSEPHWRKTQTANARLIAAAPELLEVLANYLVLGKGRCNIGKELADRALAAVRKATGQS